MYQDWSDFSRLQRLKSGYSLRSRGSGSIELIYSSHWTPECLCYSLLWASSLGGQFAIQLATTAFGIMHSLEGVDIVPQTRLQQVVLIPSSSRSEALKIFCRKWTFLLVEAFSKVSDQHFDWAVISWFPLLWKMSKNITKKFCLKETPVLITSKTFSSLCDRDMVLGPNLALSLTLYSPLKWF